MVDGVCFGFAPDPVPNLVPPLLYKIRSPNYITVDFSYEAYPASDNDSPNDPRMPAFEKPNQSTHSCASIMGRLSPELLS